jgi:excisionase family DNA binding protein
MSDEIVQPLELTTKAGTAEVGSTIGVSEVAARLGKSEKTVRRMLAKNELEGATKTPSATGDTWQIPVAAVESYLAGQQAGLVPSRVQATVSRVQELERENLEVKRENLELRHQVELRDVRERERERYLQTLEALTSRMLPAGNETIKKRWWARKNKPA